MKIESVRNGYVVETEDLYKYVFTNKKELFEYLDKNIQEAEKCIVKGCDVGV